MKPIEFRGWSSGGEQVPLIAGWGMGAVPLVLFGFAAATGQLEKQVGPDPQWPLLIGYSLLFLAGFGGCGSLLYLWSARRRARDAATFRIRLDDHGLQLSYQGRTLGMPWHDTRLEYERGDEDTQDSWVFRSSSGAFECPWLFREVDLADFVAILRVKLGKAPFSAWYSQDIQGMLIGLDDIMRRADSRQMSFAEDLCHRIVAEAEKKSQLQFGMIPVLETCQRAFEQMGKPEQARAMELRIQQLVAHLQ